MQRQGKICIPYSLSFLNLVELTRAQNYRPICRIIDFTFLKCYNCSLKCDSWLLRGVYCSWYNNPATLKFSLRFLQEDQGLWTRFDGWVPSNRKTVHRTYINLNSMHVKLMVRVHDDVPIEVNYRTFTWLIFDQHKALFHHLQGSCKLEHSRGFLIPFTFVENNPKTQQTKKRQGMQMITCPLTLEVKGNMSAEVPPKYVCGCQVGV